MMPYYELWDLDVDRVDAVATPAVRRKFLLLKEEKGKSKGGESMEEKTTVEGALELKPLAPEEKEGLKAILGTLFQLWEQNKVPDYVISWLAEAVGYPKPEGLGPKPEAYPQPVAREEPVTMPESLTPEDQERIKTFMPILTALWEEGKLPDSIINWFRAALGQAPIEGSTYPAPEPAPKPMEVEKGLLLKEIQELRKALEAERTARRFTEFRMRIEKELRAIPTPPDELAQILFPICESGPAGERVYALLKELANILASSRMLESIGTSGEVSAKELLERRATELLATGQYKTREQARAAVLKQDRELYNKLRRGE